MLKTSQENYRDNLISMLTQKPALLVFILIFTMVALNSIFNSLAVAVGLDFPKTTFLFAPNDLFADYFKVIFSYSGASDIQIHGVFSTLLSSYLKNNPYHGGDSLVSGALTHFHLTPLTTLFSLLNLQLMNYITPQWLFFVLILGFFIGVYLLIIKIACSKSDRLLWFLSVLLCYPTLLAITRGNIFAGITSLALTGYLILMSKDENKFLALFLLAIAVNIRPNAIIFILALLFGKSKSKIGHVSIFFVIAGGVFFNSLYLSNYIYPDYTLTNFLSGLKSYHAMYVFSNGGLAYGSSLYGPLKVVFGATSATEISAMILTILLLAPAVWLRWGNKISNSSFIFIICSCYVLGSSVFADYHLGVFFAPLMLYYLGGKEKPTMNLQLSDRAEYAMIYFGSVFMLVPKNYVFYRGMSAQVVLNPMALLLVTTAILFYFGYCIKMVVVSGSNHAEPQRDIL